jgi:hypothetical protein
MVVLVCDDGILRAVPGSRAKFHATRLELEHPDLLERIWGLARDEQ